MAVAVAVALQRNPRSLSSCPSTGPLAPPGHSRGTVGIPRPCADPSTGVISGASNGDPPVVVVEGGRRERVFEALANATGDRPGNDAASDSVRTNAVIVCTMYNLRLGRVLLTSTLPSTFHGDPNCTGRRGDHHNTPPIDGPASARHIRKKITGS